MFSNSPASDDLNDELLRGRESCRQIQWRLLRALRLRRYELVWLRWADFDFDANEVRIYSQKANRERVLTLDPALKVALLLWRETQADLPCERLTAALRDRDTAFVVLDDRDSPTLVDGINEPRMWSGPGLT